MTGYKLAWLNLIYTRDALYACIFIGVFCALFWYYKIKQFPRAAAVFTIGGWVIIILAAAWGLSISR